MNQEFDFAFDAHGPFRRSGCAGHRPCVPGVGARSRHLTPIGERMLKAVAGSRQTAPRLVALHEYLPWAQHIGIVTSSAQREGAVDRVEQHLAAAGVDSPVHAEAVELLARHDHFTGEYRDAVTERARFIADMAQPRPRPQPQPRGRPRTLIVRVATADVVVMPAFPATRTRDLRRRRSSPSTPYGHGYWVDVALDPGSHRGRGRVTASVLGQGDVRAGEVVGHVVQRHRVRRILNRFREAAGEPGEPGLRTATLLKAVGLLGRRMERFDAAVRIEIHGSVFWAVDVDR
jgi:hypothetical protein